MQQFFNKAWLFLCIITFSTLSYSGPWFTGPLLAPAGHTIPKGHTNLEIYGVNGFTNGRYDDSGNLIDSPLFHSFTTNPIISHGFTDWLDVQLALPYAFKATRGVSSNRLGDISAGVGIQLFEQKGSPHRVDVRIIIQEIFPTGRYDNLNPTLLGTDSTGLGGYQTQLGLNLQYLKEVFNSHYLRTRAIYSHRFAGPVNVRGLSSYGGTTKTLGHIKGGGEDTLDLAFEFTLTQNWVAVMEGTWTTGRATIFDGAFDVQNIEPQSSNIGNNNYSEKALAPALEYNFNGNIGLIGGVWFPVTGRNTSHYLNYVLALNAYW